MSSVNFKKSNAYQDKKSKFLTAKYDKQTMSLIKQRLAVEDFVYDELRVLFNCQNDEDDHDCDIDLDELLDLDTDQERDACLREKLQLAKAPQSQVRRFIDELLRRLQAL
ncbi:hypothetical protein BOX15_Mlig011906g1 [Macrostomum lignano]|uniref:Uncharacterized protein n=1 Tax=Macrostomum lignano TaxID=282301 RepID=A0A267E8F9_9PLAT|nr:hypothetical protein BOX15_Mlig011906g1 [Macrostomum lignano]